MNQRWRAPSGLHLLGFGMSAAGIAAAAQLRTLAEEPAHPLTAIELVLLLIAYGFTVGGLPLLLTRRGPGVQLTHRRLQRRQDRD